MFDVGFLSTKAPLFMDIVTLYFMILPILLFISIRFAINKKYLFHLKSQLAIFVFTILMIVVFEVGIRVMGGFGEFLKDSSVSYGFFIIYLITHILIAIMSVISWIAILIKSYLVYKENGFKSDFFKIHKKYSKLIFLGLTITAYSGVGIYYMLFLM